MTLTDLPDVDTSITHDAVAHKHKDGKREGKTKHRRMRDVVESGGVVGWTTAEDEELTTNFNE